MRQKTVGELLQEERLKHQVGLPELAKRTRIRVEYLAALEANEFSKLPAAIFVKGYIKIYASVFHFDSEPLVALLRRDFKESAKGTLVPQEFLTPVLKKRRYVTPVALTVLGLSVIFLTIMGYIAYQWYQFQQPPKVVVSEPSDFASVSQEVQVVGSTVPDAIVSVNDQPVALKPDGTFTTDVSFAKDGISTITIVAKDSRGKSTTLERHVQVQSGSR